MSDEDKGPVDHGDGKPAVSLPPGSYDGDKLAVDLESVDHGDQAALNDVILSARVEPIAPTAVTMSETGTNGSYEISAPWLDEPVKIRGKANAEAERDRLEAEGPPAEKPVPPIESVTAPNPDSQLLAGLDIDADDGTSTEEEEG